jgi:hypothetical protein
MLVVHSCMALDIHCNPGIWHSTLTLRGEAEAEVHMLSRFYPVTDLHAQRDAALQTDCPPTQISRTLAETSSLHKHSEIEA